MDSTAFPGGGTPISGGLQDTDVIKITLLITEKTVTHMERPAVKDIQKPTLTCSYSFPLPFMENKTYDASSIFFCLFSALSLMQQDWLTP